jgi:hypothetical protein
MERYCPYVPSGSHVSSENCETNRLWRGLRELMCGKQDRQCFLPSAKIPRGTYVRTIALASYNNHLSHVLYAL